MNRTFKVAKSLTRGVVVTSEKASSYQGKAVKTVVAAAVACLMAAPQSLLMKLQLQLQIRLMPVRLARSSLTKVRQLKLRIQPSSPARRMSKARFRVIKTLPSKVPQRMPAKSISALSTR